MISDKDTVYFVFSHMHSEMEKKHTNSHNIHCIN